MQQLLSEMEAMKIEQNKMKEDLFNVICENKKLQKQLSLLSGKPSRILAMIHYHV